VKGGVSETITPSAAIAFGTITSGNPDTFALGYSGAVVPSLCLDGVMATPITSGFTSTPTNMAQMFIGQRQGHNAADTLNGHIARLTYYPKRLPNATLQALTAQNASDNYSPSLQLNFAKTKRLDPRITFSRADTGASQATYFGADGLLKYAGIGEPRFDHDPVTGESLGLLIEEQRANLHLYSQDFSTGWSLSNATDSSLTPAATTAPDGTLTAGLYARTTTADVNVRLYAAANIATTELTIYTFSAYAKPLNWQYLAVSVTSGTTLTATTSAATFDLTNGTVSGATAGTGPWTITPVGNGWFKVVLTGTTVAGTTNLRPKFVLVDSANENASAAAVGVIGAGIYIWGAQLEAGSFPTSYIPTTSVAVTRNPDIASMSGVNFSSWYNQSEGTMLATYDCATFGTTGGNAGVFDIRQSPSDALNTRVLRMFTGAGGTMSAQISDANNSLYHPSDSGGTFTSASQFKSSALAYSWIDTSQHAEDGKVSTNKSMSGSVQLAATVLYIGALNNGTGFNKNGHIARLTYYPKRLPNATLQALTK